MSDRLLGKREGLTVEQMVRLSVCDFIGQPDDAFHTAAKRVLKKNAEPLPSPVVNHQRVEGNGAWGRFSHRRVPFRYASCAVLISLNPLEPIPASDSRSFFWRAISLRIAVVCVNDCCFCLRRDNLPFLKTGLRMAVMIA